MTEYDQELSQLQAQLVRKQKLEAMVASLAIQRTQLQSQEEALRNARMAEQADVDRLEGRSLSAFFYNVLGKRDEKLDKERREAYEAAVKHDAVVRELEGVASDLRNHQEELSQLTQVQTRYEYLLDQKAQFLKRSGTPNGQRILELEDRLARMEGEKKELREAIAAGQAAMDQAGLVANRLDSARGWSTWDMLGGGLISDMAKYNAMDQAQGQVEQLQVLLRRFQTELTDVQGVFPQIEIQVDGFLRFADYFFDNIFTDWAVRDRIQRAQDQVYQVVSQVQSLVNHLSSSYQDTEREQSRLGEELDQLVLKA